jgi:hypothetical protein
VSRFWWFGQNLNALVFSVVACVIIWLGASERSPVLLMFGTLLFAATVFDEAKSRVSRFRDIDVSEDGLAVRFGSKVCQIKWSEIRWNISNNANYVYGAPSESLIIVTKKLPFLFGDWRYRYFHFGLKRWERFLMVNRQSENYERFFEDLQRYTGKRDL